ncbi:MAG: hypothetical protein ACLU30_19610 [Odoribacter splanchnicus]
MRKIDRADCMRIDREVVWTKSGDREDDLEEAIDAYTRSPQAQMVQLTLCRSTGVSAPIATVVAFT